MTRRARSVKRAYWPASDSFSSGFARGTNRCRACSGDPHALTDLDLTPGAAGLVDEVADQMVGEIAQLLGGEDGVGQAGQRVAVGMALEYVVDQIVEASRQFVHSSIVG